MTWALAMVGALAALALLALLAAMRVWELWRRSEAWRSLSELLDLLREGDPTWRR